MTDYRIREEDTPIYFQGRTNQKVIPRIMWNPRGDFEFIYGTETWTPEECHDWIATLVSPEVADQALAEYREWKKNQ